VRDRRLELAGLAMILVAGGAVWSMRYPESPLVERATGWPLVGGAARALRARFLAPPEVPAQVALEPPAEALEKRGGEAHAPAKPKPAALVAAADRQRPAALRFVSRDAVEPLGPLPARPADARRLERALARLGAGAARHELGAYALWTDVEGAAELLARWRLLVAASERAWAERYGVEPLGAAAETIVLFASDAAFRVHAEETGVAAADASGVSGFGIVALAGEGRAAGEVDGALAHELAHLLARRSIGPALPPWLAEGLAEDFGEAPLGTGGELDFERVRGVVTHQHNRFEIRGGLAALDRAGQRAARGEPPELERLAAEPDAGFAAGDAGLDLYADAFVWVRFLLAEPERARGFRAFLSAVRDGGEPSLAALERRLPRPLAELASELASWLVELRRRELVAHGAPAGLPDERGVVFGETVTSLPEG